ncbi:hypothetical protein KFU94_16355 [Chloroflexi bacterium TSY]|nr:hypothetical protein [Chloroflexi bacterium TSY]
MLKNFIVKVVVAIALLIAVAGSGGIVEDTLGFDVVPKVHACGGTAGGGGC